MFIDRWMNKEFVIHLYNGILLSHIKERILVSCSELSENKPVLGFPGSAGKEHTCQYRRRKRCGFDPWFGKIPWRRSWQPTPVFLPGESHGQRSLMDYIQSVGLQSVRHHQSDLVHSTELVTQSEVSQKERKQIWAIKAYIWNLEKW